MPRFKATPTGPVPFTAAEETARDAEEAADAINRAAADAAAAQETAELAPIKAALLGPDPLTPAQIKRLFRYVLKQNGG